MGLPEASSPKIAPHQPFPAPSCLSHPPLVPGSWANVREEHLSGPLGMADMASLNIGHKERTIICFLENQKDGFGEVARVFSRLLCKNKTLVPRYDGFRVTCCCF